VGWQGRLGRMETELGREKRKEKGACDGLVQIDFWARRVLGFRIIFQISNQGFEFKINSFKYFQTEFELPSK
jgi:hypothetical protein